MAIYQRNSRSPVVQTPGSGPYATEAGTAKNTGTPNAPVRRRVRLHDQLTGRLLREQWSAEGTGAYQFQYLPAGVYMVLSLDHTGQYNGEVITDIVLPTPAP